MMIAFDNTQKIRLSAVIQTVVIVFLFLLTLLSVNNRWSQADLLLVRMLPPICILGVIALLLSKKKIHLTVVDLLLIMFALYYGFHSFYEAKYPCATQCLKFVETVLLYFVLRILFSANKVSSRVLVMLLLLCGSIEAIWGIAQLTGGGNRAQFYKISGNFLNPGPYSAYLSICSVTGLSVLANKKNKIVLLVVILMLAVIPSTWSRAAYVSVSLPVLWIFKEKYYKYRFVIWGIIVLFALAFYYLKKGSADGRLVIWTATLLSWKHYPLMGVGTGGFAHSCSEGIAEMYNNQILPSLLDSAGVAENAFNIFLKILVEQGVVGLIFFVVLLVAFFKALFLSSKPLFYGMLVLLIFSMFSYPLELLPYRIIAVMIAAWSESCRGKTLSISCAIVFPMLISIMTIITGFYLRTETYNRFVADKEAKVLSCQKGEDLMDDYYDLLSLEEDNPQFLYDFAVALSESGRLNESNAILVNGSKVSADPMYYVLIGNNYCSSNQPDEAEKAYRKAFEVLPNRIYPLYQLMQLYSDTDKKDKAEIIAKEIVDFVPKVESPATKEIKTKAKLLLLQ